jgi:hypothetical protein
MPLKLFDKTPELSLDDYQAVQEVLQYERAQSFDGIRVEGVEANTLQKYIAEAESLCTHKGKENFNAEIYCIEILSHLQEILKEHGNSTELTLRVPVGVTKDIQMWVTCTLDPRISRGIYSLSIEPQKGHNYYLIKGKYKDPAQGGGVVPVEEAVEVPESYEMKVTIAQKIKFISAGIQIEVNTTVGTPTLGIRGDAAFIAQTEGFWGMDIIEKSLDKRKFQATGHIYMKTSMPARSGIGYILALTRLDLIKE